MKKGLGIILALCFLSFLLGLAWAAKLKIMYGYEGKFGVYGIADSAVAYIDDSKIGKAKALRIIEQSPGPHHIEVELIHYSPLGQIVYEGKAIFSLGFLSRKISETSIRGDKNFDIFTSWPSGH